MKWQTFQCVPVQTDWIKHVHLTHRIIEQVLYFYRYRADLKSPCTLVV